ncbi:UNC5C-like protein [Ptychodera flava]|uniref:UNC5C-like protein n=1 Tax=Ptychodera flava TaxID=63121 RepID=UPI00396A76EE
MAIVKMLSIMNATGGPIVLGHIKNYQGLENDESEAFILIVVVALVIIILGAFLVLCCCCYRKRNFRSPSTASLPDSTRDTLDLHGFPSSLVTEIAPEHHGLYARDAVQTLPKSVFVNFSVDDADDPGMHFPESYVYNYQGTIAPHPDEFTQTELVVDGQDSESSSSLSHSTEHTHDSDIQINVNQPNDTEDNNTPVSRPVEEISHELLPDNKVKEFFTHMEHSETRTVNGKLMVFISRIVDHEGDCLVLDDMGISLLVPPGAIKEGHKETIFLILDWDLGDFPQLKPHEAIVSPVVHCGPHGLKFDKPCMLSYKHCADEAQDVSIWASQTDIMPAKCWNEHREAKKVHNDVVILEDECQIQTSHFTLFTSLLTTIQQTKKWLQLAAFARPLRRGKFYEIRVYFLHKTPCALQFAIQTEAAKFKTRLLTPPQTFLFIGDEKDMCLELDRVSDGWKNKDDEKTEVIPFLSIWHGVCPHVQFIFEPSGNSASQINATFKAYQKSRRDKCIKIKIIDEFCPHDDIVHTSDIERPQPTQNETAREAPILPRNPGIINPHHIPHELKIKLQTMLDGTCAFGQDWRGLADQIGLGEFIECLNRKDSPTYCLLDAFQKTGKDLNDLALTMGKIGREDVKRVVLEYIRVQSESQNNARQQPENQTIRQPDNRTTRQPDNQTTRQPDNKTTRQPEFTTLPPVMPTTKL